MKQKQGNAKKNITKNIEHIRGKTRNIQKRKTTLKTKQSNTKNDKVPETNVQKKENKAKMQKQTENIENT